MTTLVAFPALGFDPAPGSPSDVDALAARCAAAQRELADARDAVLRAGREGGGWQGMAADEFRSAAAELPGPLDLLARSLGEAGSALRSWHADLLAMQRSARQLEAAAAAARDGLAAAAAHPDLTLSGRVFADPTELAAAEQRLAAAERAVRERRAELDDVHRRAEQLRAEHAALAATLARALVAAGDLVPHPDAWDGQLPDDVALPLASMVRWLQDHAHTLAALADVTGDLATIIGVAGAGLSATGVGLPGGAALGTVSGVLSAVALAGHVAAKVGGADVPWDTIAWDAAGIGTFGLSRAGEVGRAVGDGIGLSTPGLQTDLERATGDHAATVFDNIEKYWVPRDPVQEWQYRSGRVGDALAVPFANAWRDGRALDAQAAREREGR